jgi:colicin import membrane protein
MHKPSTFEQEVALLPQSSERLGPGAVAAIAAHLVLLVALAYGVSWSASEPESVSAELWSSVPQVAAPKPVDVAPPPPPAPEPVKAPPPQPVVKEPPPPPQARDADIAIEKEKARKEKEKRAEAEREKQELAKAEREKARKEKAEKAQRDKLEREQAERERLEKDKLAKAKAAAEEEKRHKAEEQRLAALRADNLKRIQGLAGATGDENARGKDQRSAGPSDSYGGKIVAAILPNVYSISQFDGNPEATVVVRAAPDGTILGRRLLKSSGDKDWDDEVLRAIDRTGRLPRPDNGPVPASLELTMRPKPAQRAG